MKKLFCHFPLAGLTLFSASVTYAQGDPKLTEVWNPVPRIVSPGKTSVDPPADAIVLFNGKDFSNWRSVEGSEIAWRLENDAMTVSGKTGDIQTNRGFGDCQLYIEWRTPAEVKGNGQGRGNSGIFFMGRYELQVLDSYENSTYSNGQAGSIYKQHIPLVNACRPPGDWQSYDVIFTAPRFNSDSTLKSQAHITVFQNGVFSSKQYWPMGKSSLYRHSQVRSAPRQRTVEIARSWKSSRLSEYMDTRAIAHSSTAPNKRQTGARTPATKTAGKLTSLLVARAMENQFNTGNSLLPANPP